MSASSTNCGDYTYGDWSDLKKTLKDSPKKDIILKELRTIAKEEEEDKEKYLPLFNPEDLDI
jgi:hypothetical protein